MSESISSTDNALREQAQAESAPKSYALPPDALHPGAELKQLLSEAVDVFAENYEFKLRTQEGK